MSTGPIIGPSQQQALRNALRGSELEGLNQGSQTPFANGADAANPLEGFTNLLENKLNAVNDVMANSDQKIQSFVRGEETSIHEVMIAMSKADVSFRMMSQVGRKVIEAYQEIMRMQV